MIEGDDAVVEPATEPDIPNGAARPGRHEGVLDAGEQIGTIADVYFEEDDGRIVGFEVSGGHGRRHRLRPSLPAGRGARPHRGRDRVRPTGDGREPRTGPGRLHRGVGAVDDIKAKAADAAQEAGEKLSEAAPRSRRPVPADGEGQATAHPAPTSSGRRSGSDVTDADGRIIVANGQVDHGGARRAGERRPASPMRCAPPPTHGARPSATGSSAGRSSRSPTPRAAPGTASRGRSPSSPTRPASG